VSAEKGQGIRGAVALRVLSGARVGTVLSLAGRSVSLGRHPDSDLALDPETDRAVSARHAVLAFDGEVWTLRDLGSTNGTFLNGRPAIGEVPLSYGDRITLGKGGPDILVEPPSASAGTTGRSADGSDTGERIRVAVGRRTRFLSAAVGALALTLVLTVFLTLRAGERERTEWDRERDAMRLEIDSVRWAGAQARIELEGQLASLTTLLRSSEERVRTLESGLRRAESAGSTGEARDLRLELAIASAELEAQRSAASLDFQTIQGGTRPAVSMIYVEMPNGVVTAGTAFAVRPDATLVTSRHVVAGARGQSRPRRIAIQFSDSDQVWPARVLAVATDADLAVVKVDNILGDVPVTGSFNLRPDTLPPHAPVAAVGFPLGGEAQSFPPGRGGVARPVISAGNVLGVERERIDVLGYGAIGASGSPLVDSRGEVIGVVFGGRTTPDGHALVAVPALAVQRLLDSIR
jgi:S1-C subfamily serine protease